jgi:hypothetical protein
LPELLKNKSNQELRKILCRKFQSGPHRGIVKRYYAEWRNRHNIPDRCDNLKCSFFKKPLIWNTKPVPLDLDHESGNTKDNRPENLRYLCPICHRQTQTFGGGNKGRIIDSPDGYSQITDKKSRATTHRYFPNVTIPAMRASGTATVKASKKKH